MHVPVPAGCVGGQRLLLSVPLPPQSLCVCLPAAAVPGRQVQFPLPPPSSEPEQTWDGPASASGGLPQLPHRGRGLLAWTEDEQKSANIGVAEVLAEYGGLYGKSRDSPISPPM